MKNKTELLRERIGECVRFTIKYQMMSDTRVFDKWCDLIQAEREDAKREEREKPIYIKVDRLTEDGFIITNAKFTMPNNVMFKFVDGDAIPTNCVFEQEGGDDDD